MPEPVNRVGINRKGETWLKPSERIAQLENRLKLLETQIAAYKQEAAEIDEKTKPKEGHPRRTGRKNYVLRLYGSRGERLPAQHR